MDAAEAALSEIANSQSLQVSERHRTEPVGGPAGQQMFLNAAATFAFEGSPAELLLALQQVESAAGRHRTQRWDSRTLDIDLLLFADQVIRRSDLRVPHPRMTFRPFVLEPAAEIAADWRHPECNATLGEVLGMLQDGQDCVRLIEDLGEVRGWVEATHADRVRIDTQKSSSGQPKLTIDASEHGSVDGLAGPRLVLADCPPEHWQDEVAAALECVWPTPSC